MQSKHQIQRNTHHKLHSSHKERPNTSLFPEWHFPGDIVVQPTDHKKADATDNGHSPVRMTTLQNFDAIIKAPSDQKEDAAFD